MSRLSVVAAAVSTLSFCPQTQAQVDEPAGTFGGSGERLRIERPGQQPAQQAAVKPVPKESSCCLAGVHSSSCQAEQPGTEQLLSRLPAEGLYERWRRRFVIPTICPINRCHGSCSSSGMGCSMRLNSLELFFDECDEAVETVSLSADRATCCGGGRL